MFDSLVLASLLAASLVTTVKPPAQPVASAQSLAFEAKIDDVIRALEKEDAVTAVRLLDELLAAPGFAVQPSAQRYRVTAMAGMLAQGQERTIDAQRLLSAATGFEQASLQIWRACADASLAREDGPEAARCLGQSLRRWPDSVEDLNDDAVFQITRELDDPGNEAIYRIFLLDLFDAGWTSDEKIIDHYWVELAALLLADGQSAKAIEVATRIDDPRSIASMRVDRRFDAVAQLQAGIFDVERAIERTASKDVARMHDAPEKLAPVMLLQANMLDALRFDDVIASADRIIETVRASAPDDAYEDQAQMYAWVLNQRAEALAGAGRWDAAVRALEQGARRPEYGGLNISQIINLSLLYVRVGRAQDALESIAEVGSMSSYGRMQQERGRLYAAVALRDKARAAESLAYLQAHREDSFDALQAALLAVADHDASVALLVERLRREDLRDEALLAVQTWAQTATTRWDRRQARQWRKVVASRQVQAAVQEVGRIEAFPLGPTF